MGTRKKKTSYSNLPEPIKDIPSDRVGRVVQSFIDNDGAKKLSVDQQSNGTFTVAAVK